MNPFPSASTAGMRWKNTWSSLISGGHGAASTV